MNLVFAGFGLSGEKCLTALADAGWTPRLVISPADREIEPMRRLAQARRLAFRAADDVNALAGEIAPLAPDLLVAASYPQLFRRPLLALPRLGALNVHTSLLPRGRGVHPLNWALIRGEEEVGVTVHFMDEGMDSGDIVAQRAVPVGIEDDINTLRERLTTLGAELLVAAVRQVEHGCATRQPQDHARATLAPRRGPEDSRLTWPASSREVFNFCRALYTPYPPAFSFARGEPVRVEKVHVSATPGRILAKVGERDYVVATTDGTVFVTLDRADLAVGDTLT
jgi:methionyl-tRNA formyltransferase